MPTRSPATLYPLQLAAPDILEWLLGKEPRAIGMFDEIGSDEYARAFTAAQTAGTDIADDLYYVMVDVVERSGSEQDFAKLVMPILKEKGWLGGDEGKIGNRVRLIYDTNLRLARAAGRWNHVQASEGMFPYLRAFTVGDSRVRHPPKSEEDHRAWDGIVLPVSHPFWRTYWPPLGFRCRCSVGQMSRSQLARYRDGITSEDELAWRIERLGPPVFAPPAAPIGQRLAEMVEASNSPSPRKSSGWTVNGESGLSAEQANMRIEASRARMPGLPPVNPIQTERAGRDIWDAVISGRTLDEISRNVRQVARR